MRNILMDRVKYNPRDLVRTLHASTRLNYVHGLHASKGRLHAHSCACLRAMHLFGWLDGTCCELGRTWFFLEPGLLNSHWFRPVNSTRMFFINPTTDLNHDGLKTIYWSSEYLTVTRLPSMGPRTSTFTQQSPRGGANIVSVRAAA